jgi:exonuclease III
VIGGDFNAWDHKDDTEANCRWRDRWLGLWSRLEALDMVNLLKETRATRPRRDGCGCGLGDKCWHFVSVRRKSNALTDYLWVTPDLAPGCTVGVIDINDSELKDVSDHSPVWADLTL